MNIFFGKISKLFDTNQIEGGYYISAKGSSWFGDLNIGDYVYLIGGDKIQFWQAKEWGEKDGKECLFFDILNPDLGIKISQLSMLKFLKMTKALVVLTSRSAKNKAFFRLELIKDVTPEYLADNKTYLDGQIFRKLRVEKSIDTVKETEDIVVYYENENLKLYPSKFIEQSILEGFRDNTKFIGLGSIMKDNVLSYFNKNTKTLPAILDQNKISLRSFYDAFFCEYKEKKKYFLVGAFWDTSNPQDQTERFTKDGIWFNGYEDKFNDEVNAVPVGSNIAIKAAFVREKTKSVMTIKARGVVTENPQDGQTLNVDWEDDFTPFEVGFGGYMKTIKEVSKAEHIKSIWSPEINNIENTPEVNSLKTQDKINTFPINQILYGPPGTGKTFNSINKALEIINEEEEKELNWKDRKAIKDLFNKRVDEGRIVFTTFHQSMSYEDFIEGIKPKIDEDTNENKQVIYEVENGIFKRLVENAKKKRTASKEIIESYSFDDAWDDLVNEAEGNLEENNPLFLSIQTPNLGLKIIELSERGNLKLKPIYSNDAKEYTVSFLRTKKLQETFPDLSVIKNIDKEFRAVIGGSNSTAYWSVLNYINQKINNNSKISKQENELPPVPYILIIDEINRGNVSAIFGELITLIEEDKRLGKEEALEVTLPYSKEKFGVPANLFIIGTMNTADRSVEALDAALRRRFCFEEMPPLSDLNGLQNDIFGYKAFEILKTVNSRIEKLIDKDHAIGHSYLLNKDHDSIVDSFYKNIIPLLQEYFFGDYGKLGLVLGKGFVHLKEWDKGTDAFADFDDDASNDFDNRNVYEIIDYRKVTDYKLPLSKVEEVMNFEKAIQVLMNKKFD